MAKPNDRVCRAPQETGALQKPSGDATKGWLRAAKTGTPGKTVRGSA
ncbi:hypothetical protein [Treponema endosymbiont of Eucomonympha sp.]|nr:hypothetical protein [Treponema endosymbiont of Eucomonympha sp.]